MRHLPATPPVIPRRRPQQSRARHTSGALQEAFVRLLVERNYDAITIREIVDLAGTGLGSFYEYAQHLHYSLGLFFRSPICRGLSLRLSREPMAAIARPHPK